MTFQPIFDRATQIAINRRRNVSQTVSRDGVVKSTSLGGQTWQFTVDFPNNQPYAAMRPIIEALELAGRVQSHKVKLNKPGHAWINGYQGDLTSLTGIQVSVTSGNTVTITSGATNVSGTWRFKAGDYIQLVGGGVYTITDNISAGNDVLPLNRPLREAPGTYGIQVGQNVEWDLICVSMPNWVLTTKNLVSWDGPFVFAEVVA